MSSVAEPRRALVTGAGGVVGVFLLPRLAHAGFEVLAVSRRTVATGPGSPGSRGTPGSVRWIALDLASGALPDGPVPLLLHAAPIWLLPPLLPSLAALGLRRVVAFSSTSRFTKQDSPNHREQDVARRLAGAEEATAEVCQRHGIAWTIFRPTLIYGAGLDRNVSDIARALRRFGVFPIVGEGRGLRQPVHADDLAAACLAVLDKPATFSRAYDLPGGETLSYREMVQRIAEGLGRRAWLPAVPQALLRAALAAAGRLPGLGHVTPEMADRMSEDLVFDGTAARHDFGWAPRPFRYVPGERPPAV